MVGFMTSDMEASASNLDTVISLNRKPSQILPEEAFSWLVQHHLSYEEDTQ